MEVPSVTAEAIARSVAFKELQIGVDFSARDLKEQAELSCEELKRRYELSVRKITLDEIHAGVSCRPLHVMQNAGFDKLVASLEAQGWNTAYSMIVQEFNQGFRVIEGNHRWLALKLLQARGSLVDCNQEKWKICALVLRKDTPRETLFRIGTDANASAESHAGTPFVQLFKTIDYFQRAEGASGPSTSSRNAFDAQRALGYTTRWRRSYFREIFQTAKTLSRAVKDELYRLASKHPNRFAMASTQTLLMNRQFRRLDPLFQRHALAQLTTAEPDFSVNHVIAVLLQRSLLHGYVSSKPPKIIAAEKKTALLQNIYEGGFDQWKTKYKGDIVALYATMDQWLGRAQDAGKCKSLQPPNSWATVIWGAVGTAALKAQLPQWHGQVELALFDPPFALPRSSNAHDIIDRVTMHATASLLNNLLHKKRGLMIFSHNYDHRNQWAEVMELHGFQVSRVPFYAQEGPGGKPMFGCNLFRSTVTQWMIAGRCLKTVSLAESFQKTPLCMNNFHSFARPSYHERVQDVQRGGSLRTEQKSIELMLFFLERFAEPDVLVLDPFMGTGSTGVAALQHGCHFLGIEANKECAQLAQERLDREQATQGIRALKNGDPIKTTQKQQQRPAANLLDEAEPAAAVKRRRLNTPMTDKPLHCSRS